MSALAILERTFRGIDIARNAKRAGVYLLIDGSDIVYVGASRNIVGRVAGWLSRSDAPDWDRAIWLPIPWPIAMLYEHALIRELGPRHNNRCHELGHEEEILFGLGLRDSLDEGAVAWESA